MPFAPEIPGNVAFCPGQYNISLLAYSAQSVSYTSLYNISSLLSPFPVDLIW